MKPVGRGGFSVVWEAYDRLNDQRVALKVLHAHLAGEPLRRDRFFRGARAMRTLACPAVVQVLEPEQEDGGYYYFTMEFVPGGNLSEAVLGGRLATPQILPLLVRVCEAVAEAHREGMIHRDIKPSNILLDADGYPKLTDFDLVGARDTTGGTRTGALGTFLYAAPECLDRPQEATPRADIYGLGMTAIFCLSGQELTRSIFRTPEPAIAALRCSRPVKAVLAQAVAWEPGERFADAGAMARALREALDERLSPVPAAESAPRSLAAGSTPPDAEDTPDPLDTPLESRPTAGTPLPSAPALRVAATLRSHALWLAGAVGMAALAASVTFAEHAMLVPAERAVTSALSADVERLAATFDAAARSAHTRADGIATTPMLRAGIETHAATLNDLANTDMLFTPGRGEVLEVFQFRDDRVTPLLRLPKNAPSVQLLKGRNTRFRSDGKGVSLDVSALVSGYRAGIAGGVVLSVPIDLTPIERALGEHATRASLTGLGNEFALVGSDDGAGMPTRYPVPSSGDWNAADVAVLATPKPATGQIRAWPARGVFGGMAVLLLAGFLARVVRRPRS